MLTKAEATVTNIFTAASYLFLATNYSEVTMEQIARASNVTKGALYHHFASKEDLYLALLHADLSDKKRRFTQAIDTDGSCRERLRRLCEVVLLLPREKRQLISLIRRDINIFSDPARTELVRAYQASLPDLIERVIRDGIQDGTLADADARLLSWHFVAMVEVTLCRYADGIFENTDKRLDYVLDLFFNGATSQEGANK